MRKIIDLRSDTSTRPTQAMRRAMGEAEVGNDGFGEDPTVNRLQERAAEMLGKEAALFVPSGTMGNLCAILTHCRRGDAVILDAQAHTFHDESGNLAAVAGCLAHTLDCADGAYDLDELAAAIEPGSLGRAWTGLVCLENTHNRRGGIAVSVERTRQVAKVAHDRGVPVHLDGARIFNAAVALGVRAAELAEPCDSIQFCLSKGLGCPVGSLLVGRGAFIERAKKARRMLGGAMRQAGIIAAAGLVAFDTMIERLAEDHARARALAAGLESVAGLYAEPNQTVTNMACVALKDPAKMPALIRGLAERGVRVLSIFPGALRLVTHYEIGDAEVEQTIEAFGQVMADLG